MVQVQFYLFDQANSLALEGLEVLVDGVPKVTNEYGTAIFENIAQGSHSYEVRISDYYLDYARDPFDRPLGISGTFTIEWVPDPSQPYPETFPWINEFYFMPGVTPPPPPSIGLVIPVIAIAGVLLLSNKKG